jgi:hypothetical protein
MLTPESEIETSRIVLFCILFELNGHTTVTEDPHLIFADVRAFGSDLLIMNRML